MFKRVRWMGLGAVAGVGMSAWTQRKLRRTLDGHPAIRTGADGAALARRVTREVRAAVADGRAAMTEREATLRAGLDGAATRPAATIRPDGVSPPDAAVRPDAAAGGEQSIPAIGGAGRVGRRRAWPVARGRQGRRPPPPRPAVLDAATGRPQLHIVDPTAGERRRPGHAGDGSASQ
jgi:hypothetical protein